jgi:hypothetical protein
MAVVTSDVGDLGATGGFCANFEFVGGVGGGSMAGLRTRDTFGPNVTVFFELIFSRTETAAEIFRAPLTEEDARYELSNRFIII